LVLKKLGGFCGESKSDNDQSIISISNCISKGKVEGGLAVGGFVGYNVSPNKNSIISNCYNRSKVKGNKVLGGFCGTNYNGYISKCYNQGNITCIKRDDDYTSIYIGGFCGSNVFHKTKYGANIENCYNTGDIHCLTDIASLIGGFCGINIAKSSGQHLSISNCYSVGIINGNDLYHFGGFCGNQEGTGYYLIKECYWDVQTSKIETSDGGIGLSTSELKNKDNYQGWDFNTIWSIDPNINNGYPYLKDTAVVKIEKQPKIAMNKIILYPNPATEKITVSSNLLIGKEIQIYNILGSRVWKGRANDYNFDIDISTLARNIYILRIDEEALMFIKN
jgi:hypothetical protein